MRFLADCRCNTSIEAGAIVQRSAYWTLDCACMHNEGNAGSFPQLVSLSKTFYHACFIYGQGCKCLSRQPKLTSSVISDVKPIIYLSFLVTLHGILFLLQLFVEILGLVGAACSFLCSAVP